jgi:hypothetical protein
MRERHATESSHGYDWSRFGRHRLRTPAGALIDSPLGSAGTGWLGTLGPSIGSTGWERLLWKRDPHLGGWTIPARLAGGDVIEFGADHDGQVIRWYGLVDSFDATEWLTVQGPYPDPAAAHDHAERMLAAIRLRTLVTWTTGLRTGGRATRAGPVRSAARRRYARRCLACRRWM